MKVLNVENGLKLLAMLILVPTLMCINHWRLEGKNVGVLAALVAVLGTIAFARLSCECWPERVMNAIVMLLGVGLILSIVGGCIWLKCIVLDYLSGTSAYTNFSYMLQFYGLIMVIAGALLFAVLYRK